MTICINEKDTEDSDEFYEDGYTACCPDKDCQSQIGVEKYFAYKVGKPKNQSF